MVKKIATSPPPIRNKFPAQVPVDETPSFWETPTVRLVSIGVLIVAFAFFVMNAIFGDNGWMVHRRQQRQIEILKQEVNRLQKENQDLDKQIQGLRSDPKVIDRLAHDQLHLVGPNQTIYTFPDQDAKSNPRSVPGETPPPTPAKP